MKWRSVLWLGLDRFLNTPARRWAARIGFWALFLLVVFPYFLSRVITEPPGLPISQDSPANYHLNYESFTVPSFDGVPIAGWWIPSEEFKIQDSHQASPARRAKFKNIGKPVILFAHGLGTSKSDYAVNADFAHQRGYSCCLIDLRNHGESGKKYITLGADESRDLRAVMRWLREKKGVKGFILWGVSLGAASSLLAAADEPDVDGVILEACYESMRGTVDRHRRLYFSWVPKCPFVPLTLGWFRLRTGVDPDEVDLVRAASRLKRGRMFLVVGEKDLRAPASAGELLVKSSGIPAEMWVMPGIDHDSLGGHPEYESKIEAFLKSLELLQERSKAATGVPTKK